MKKIFKNVCLVLVAIFLLSTFSCSYRLENAPLNLVSNNRSILKYLQNDSNYTVLVRALEITNLSAMLNIYGSYTLFAPTNAAFRTYLTSKKLADITAMDKVALLNLIKYHLYNEQYGSTFFLSGSLPTTTASGDFIKMDISNGVKNTLLNNSVKVDSLDIPVTNGVVHVIGSVLEPPALNLYNWIKTQPQYSIITEAFEKTNNVTLILNQMAYDSIKIVYGQPELKKFTVFLESNTVLAAAGIKSFDDLARKYSNSYKTTKTYTDATDSLNIFIRYHCIPQKLFVSDFTDNYLETGSHGDFIIFNTSGGISLNKHTVDQQVLDPATGLYTTVTNTVKAELDLTNSNQVTKNGIVHSVKSVLSVFNPTPVTVTQLFAGAPADRKITLLDGTVTQIQDQWANLNNNPTAQSVVWWLKWSFAGSCTMVINASSTFSDYVISTGGATAVSVELTTKPVFKGKYDVYLVYYLTTVQTRLFMFYMDGVQLGDIVNVYSKLDDFGNAYTMQTGRKLGTVTFTELKAHTFKMLLVKNSNNLTFFYSVELRPAR